MKYLFSRHWKSGSKGQQPLRDEKQTRSVLPLAQLTAFRDFPGWAPGGGSEANSLDCRDEAECWRRARQLEFTGQRSSDKRERERENAGIWKGLPPVLSRVMSRVYLWRHCLRPRKETFKKIMEQCLVLTQDRQLYLLPPARLDYT